MQLQRLDWFPPKRPDGSIDVRRYLAALDHAYNEGLPSPRTEGEWARIEQRWRTRRSA